mgnify:CR=1 FL=1
MHYEQTQLMLGALAILLLVVLALIVVKELIFLRRENKTLKQINRDLQTGFDDIYN